MNTGRNTGGWHTLLPRFPEQIYSDKVLTSRLCRIEGAREGFPDVAGTVFMRRNPLPLWWRPHGADGVPLRHVPALARLARRLCRRQAGRLPAGGRAASALVRVVGGRRARFLRPVRVEAVLAVQRRQRDGHRGRVGGSADRPQDHRAHLGPRQGRLLRAARGRPVLRGIRRQRRLRANGRSTPGVASAAASN